MTERKFAPWVEPVAAQLRQSRAQVPEVARQVPNDSWGKEGRDPGWTYKDLLAHLAAGDWAIQLALRSIVEGAPPDLSVVSRIDEINEQNRRERLDRPVEALLAEATRMGEETQGLLTALKPGQEDLEVATWELSDLLQGFSRHDPFHLDQLRTAVTT